MLWLQTKDPFPLTFSRWPYLRCINYSLWTQPQRYLHCPANEHTFTLKNFLLAPGNPFFFSWLLPCPCTVTKPCSTTVNSLLLRNFLYKENQELCTLFFFLASFTQIIVLRFSYSFLFSTSFLVLKTPLGSPGTAQMVESLLCRYENLCLS